eukprot:CAMPEP_0197032548 /NCGR_PEP_ID=MMETSP1384-20130603/11201_1 /TAXON_ID=29189 /ORGANISM="Ammonia sp." /LENGTH=549 /DNA_ID=CAMNT_0042462231 /DNA_START=49 /DNA_END=1698 /DNA_ORIENTATION=+
MYGPVSHWTVDDVAKYISRLEINGFKYADHAEMFRKEIINGRLLLNLQKDDLNVLGIHQFSKRNALYEHLQQLKSKPSKPPPESSIASILKEPPSIYNYSPALSPQQSPVISTLNNANSNGNVQSHSNGNHAHNAITVLQSLQTLQPLQPPNATQPQQSKEEMNYSNAAYQTPRSTQPHTVDYHDILRRSSLGSMSIPSISRQSSTNASISNILNSLNANSPIFGASFPPPLPTTPTLMSPSLMTNATMNPLLTPTSYFKSMAINMQPLNHATTPNHSHNSFPFPSAVEAEQKEAALTMASGMAAGNEVNLNCTEIRKIPNQYHLVKVAGIYQGINSHHLAFMLMTRQNIEALNDLYKEYSVLEEENQFQVKRRNENVPLQQFKCNIATEKIQHGWLLGNVDDDASAMKLRLPFNPLVEFTLNLLSNEIVEIAPIFVSGQINNINRFGAAWITSDLQINAIEQVSNSERVLISNIISLQIVNVSHNSLQQREASYMIHDPEYQDKLPLHKGMNIKFCLKLSTRTNRKDPSKQKPVFIQAWNVKTMPPSE